MMFGNGVLERFRLYPGAERCMECWRMAHKLNPISFLNASRT